MARETRMKDVIIVLIVVAILAAAAWYVYKAKKSGKKCIGCPNAQTCAAKKGGCGCGCSIETTE